MTVFFGEKTLLDPEQCWNDWVELGSLTKVRRKLLEEGIVHPVTGLPPTISAIQKAAYAWAVSSPEKVKEARERFDYECQKRAIIPTDEIWKQKLYSIGRLLYYQRPKLMNEFVANYGLQQYAK